MRNAAVRTVAGRACAPVGALADATMWRAIGKIAVRIADEGESGSFRWHQSGSHWRLDVNGPFGSGAAEIRGGPDGARLDDGRGPPRWYPDPERLALDALGVPVPLRSVSAWLRGHPGPGVDPVSIERGPTGRIVAFREAGWQVRVLREIARNGQPVPALVEALRDTARVRVSIREWDWPLAGADLPPILVTDR